VRANRATSALRLVGWVGPILFEVYSLTKFWDEDATRMQAAHASTCLLPGPCATATCCMLSPCTGCCSGQHKSIRVNVLPVTFLPVLRRIGRGLYLIAFCWLASLLYSAASTRTWPPGWSQCSQMSRRQRGAAPYLQTCCLHASTTPAALTSAPALTAAASAAPPH
jgi:hypothetical protein